MALGPSLGKAYIEIVGDVSNFDTKLALQLKAIGIGFSALAGGGEIAGLSGQVVGLAGQLVQLSGLLVALPAVVGIAGAAFAGLLIPMSGFSNVLKGLTSGNAQAFQKALENLSPAARSLALELKGVWPEIDNIRKSAQQAFSEQLVGQIKATADALSGPLANGLSLVSRMFGQQTQLFLTTLRSADSIRVINDLFVATAQIVGEVLQAFQPLVRTFLQFIEVGLGPLGKVADLLTVMIHNLNVMAQGWIANGTAARWLNDAFVVFGQLWRIASNFLAVLSDILSIAARSQSGGLLPGLDSSLSQLRAFLQTADGIKGVQAVFDTLGEIAKQASPVIIAFVKAIGENLPSVLPAVTASIRAFGAVIAQLGPSLNSLIPALAQVFVSLADAIVKIAPDLPGVVAAIAQLIQVLAPFAPEIVAISIAISALSGITGLIAPLIALAAAFGLVDLAAAPVALVLLGLTLIVIGLLSLPWGKIGHAIADAFDTARHAVAAFIDGLGGFFVTLGKKLLAGLEAIPKLIGDALKAMFDAVMFVIGVGIGLILFAVLKLPGLLVKWVTDLAKDVAKGWDDFWTGLLDTVVKVAEAIPKLLIDAAVAIVKIVKGLPDDLVKLGKFFLDAGKKLIEGFLTGLAATPKFLANLGKTILNGVVGFINANVIDQINKGIGTVGKFVGGLPTIPHIPMLAEGDVVRRPTLAVIGESGPEAVVPLNRPRRAQAVLQQAGLAGPSNVNVRVFVGTTELREIIDTQIDESNEGTATALSGVPKVA